MQAHAKQNIKSVDRGGAGFVVFRRRAAGHAQPCRRPGPGSAASVYVEAANRAGLANQAHADHGLYRYR